MVSKLALGAIWGYQKFLSPRKGFRCAHSVLHGGTGCSGYAKYAIREHGLFGAIPQILQRFRDCKTASATLRSQCALHSEPHDDDHPRRGRKGRRQGKGKEDRDGWCDLGCDACDCASGPCAVLPAFCAIGAFAPAPKGNAQSPDAPAGDAPAPDAAPSDGCGIDGCGGDCGAVPDCGGCTPDCSCAPSCG